MNEKPATMDDAKHIERELNSLGYADVKFRADDEGRIIAIGSGRHGVRAPNGGHAPAETWVQAVVCQLEGTVH